MLQELKEFTVELKQKRGMFARQWANYCRAQNGVLDFLKKIQASQNIINYISQDPLRQMYLKRCLDSLDSTNEDLQKMTERFLRMMEPSEDMVIDRGNVVSRQQMRDKIKVQKQMIDGSDLAVIVNYNPDRLDIKYNYQSFHLQNLLKVFVVVQLSQKSQFTVDFACKSLFLWDGKRYFQNKYVEAYLFDPFFNSINFQLIRKGKNFENNFEITNYKKINIQLRAQKSSQYWSDDKDFTNETTTETIVDYIVKKERADPSVKPYLMYQLKQYHGINNIGDFLKFDDIKEFAKNIAKQKWACELLVLLQKYKRKEIKSSFNTHKQHPNKIMCLKMAYSHKILRYLFLKNNKDSIHLLKCTIPYLNQKIIKEAIRIIKHDLIISGLLDKVENELNAFSFTPGRETKYKNPGGVLFYGPPGTGKTRLTEDLPELMGFHLISNGLSSTNFMKELVGGAKGTVEGYFIRALESPHLICSIAIDQIDPLIMRRGQGGGSKGSDETISKFLSMMGGNESVENLLVIGSTNLFNKIDEAMLRRFNANFYVGLPSREERKKILACYNSNLTKMKVDVDFLVDVTPNFSGAGLELVCQGITRGQPQRVRGQIKWDHLQLLQLVSKVAQSLKISFGDQTYPELIADLQKNKNISLSFLDHTQNKTAIFIQEEVKTFMCYQLQENQFVNNQMRNKYTFCKNSVPIPYPLNYSRIVRWLQNGGNNFDAFQLKDQMELKQKIIALQIKPPNKSTVLLLQIPNSDWINNLSLILVNQKKTQNVFFCFYTSQPKVGLDICRYFTTVKENYTARILVDLSQNYPKKMEFQIQPSQNYQRTENLAFIKKDVVIKNQEEYYSQIVEKLLPRDLSFIQLIDNTFFASFNTFEDQGCLQLLQSKIGEAKKYKKSALIIDFDSLIKLNKSISKSNSGSESLSIDRPNLYRELINNVTKLMKFNNQKELWVVVIVKDEDLAKLVRRDISWPLSAEQKKDNYEQDQKKKKEEENQQTRTCKYCNQFYTEEENIKQRKCQSHFGELVYMETCNMMKDLTLEQARFNTYVKNLNQEKAEEFFLYSCCWQNLGTEGCRTFKHCAGGYDEDEIFNEKEFSREKRQKLLDRLKRQNIQFLNRLQNRVGHR